MTRGKIIPVIAGVFLVSTVWAERPQIIAETDEYWLYADQSIEFKPEKGRSSPDPQREHLRAEAKHAAEASRGTLVERGIPGEWKGFGGVPLGCNGIVRAIEKGSDGKIYLAGEFSACNDVIVNNIAAWDPATNEFEALGSPAGVRGEIHDLTISSEGDLLVAGSFGRNAGGVWAQNIARWNGSDWAAISPDGFSSTIFAVEADPNNGNIYIGGAFTRVYPQGEDTLVVDRIAVWDGTAWAGLGDGFNSTVYALQYHDGALHAGGWFTQSGEQSVSYIAAWGGTQWAAMGSGTDGMVSALESDGTRLFAGGRFNFAGEVETGPVAAWDGTEWSSIDGPGCCFNNGDMHYADGKLFITGGFHLDDGTSTIWRVAIWDGTSWSGTPDESTMSGSGAAIYSDGGDIFVGGSFSVIGAWSSQYPGEGTFANRIARFNAGSAKWEALGHGDGHNLNGPVSDLLEYDGEVWVVGRFDAAGTRLMPRGLARWNGSEWLAVPGDNLPCGSFRLLEVGANDGIFATHSCMSSVDTNWGLVAHFDGTSWNPMADGLPNALDITVDPETGYAYYMGSFTETGGESPSSVNRIAFWDGSDWNSVGTGSENGVSNSESSYASVRATAVNNGQTMVAGSFDRAGTIDADRIAYWDGDSWAVPGAGLSRPPYSVWLYDLELHGEALFAAGLLSHSGDQEMRNIAEWDGTAWQPLQGAAGEGIGYTPTVMHATEDGLYVGGHFLEAGGRPANRIARWGGNDWLSLGYGSENGLTRVNSGGGIEAIQATENGIFVGGTFGGSSTVTSPNLIRFVPDPPVIFQDDFKAGE